MLFFAGSEVKKSTEFSFVKFSWYLLRQVQKLRTVQDSIRQKIGPQTDPNCYAGITGYKLFLLGRRIPEGITLMSTFEELVLIEILFGNFRE